MYQKTIAKEVKFSGNGLHTGEFTNLLLKPSMPNTGIIFRFHKNDNTYDIEANINNLFSTNRGTTLVSSANNNYKIFTTEHLLSALYSLEIDNLIIEIDNIEVPILDGSSKKYITQINNVGIKTFKDKKDYLVIDKNLIRQVESDNRVADPKKAQEILNWKPKFSFDDLVADMVESDLKLVTNNL